jgi:hypothetical protein
MLARAGTISATRPTAKAKMLASVATSSYGFHCNTQYGCKVAGISMKKSSANNITVKTADVSRSTVHIMDAILAADMGRHAQGYVANAAVRILRTVEESLNCVFQESKTVRLILANLPTALRYKRI